MKKRKNKKNKVKFEPMQSKFDTQGSYTGVDSCDKRKLPVQDADDL